MNICLTSATGNMGKSTLAINLGLCLLNELNNNQVNLIDGDQIQKTFSDFMDIRIEKQLKLAKKCIIKEELILEQLKDRTKLNLIDLRGDLSIREANIIKQCDLILVISGNDQMEIKKTFNFCKELSKFNINYKILINKYKEDRLTFDTLKNIFKDRLLTNFIKDKKSYAKYFEDGTCVYDGFLINKLGLRLTKDEFLNVKNELFGILKITK